MRDFTYVDDVIVFYLLLMKAVNNNNKSKNKPKKIITKFLMLAIHVLQIWKIM